MVAVTTSSPKVRKGKALTGRLVAVPDPGSVPGGYIQKRESRLTDQDRALIEAEPERQKRILESGDAVAEAQAVIEAAKAEAEEILAMAKAQAEVMAEATAKAKAQAEALADATAMAKAAAVGDPDSDDPKDPEDDPKDPEG